MTHPAPAPETTDSYPVLAAAINAELAAMGVRMAAVLNSQHGIGCEYCESLAFVYALENWSDHDGLPHPADTATMADDDYAEVQRWAAVLLVDGESITCPHRNEE